MAHCVVSMIVDTDNGDAYVPACIVHTRYAPCHCDGEPASPTPLHVWSSQGPDAVRAWELRTGQQRPLVIHQGDLDDDIEHQVDGPRCWCNPDIIGARP